MPRRTKEEAEQTRTAVLNSALDLFYEKGYSRTTFDEIAKRINLTKGAVYWHFRNKADLLAELMRIKCNEQQEKTAIKTEEIQTFADFRASMLHDVREMQNNKEFCKFLFFIMYQMES